MFSVVENVRQKQLAWLRATMSHLGVKYSRLAKDVGVDHTTLGKFLRDSANTSTLSAPVVDKIAAFAGIPPYETAPVQMPRGLAESEAVPYDSGATSPVNSAISAMKTGRNGVDPWILQSRALEGVGCMPGDVLMVDLNAEPQNGDVVCAQVYDRLGRAETVMRVYEDPFLVAASLDPKVVRPMLVDNDRVQIRGVVIATLRDRRAA